jgi:DNA-binding ferritin-like protein
MKKQITISKKQWVAAGIKSGWIKTASMAYVVRSLVQLRDQIQYLHWQTDSFAEHKAFDVLYETVNEKLDELVEVYQGKYGNIGVDGEVDLCVLEDKEGVDVGKFLDSVINTLTTDVDDALDESDTDIKNIRDEILGAINKLKYLLTLK